MATRAVPVPWSAAWPLLCLAGRVPIFAHAGLAVVQALLPFAGLLTLQWLIDAVASGLSQRTPAADALPAATLAVGAAALVALVGSVLRSLNQVLAENHGRALTDAATFRLQAHAARLDLAEFDRPAFHDLLQRAGTEASQRPVRLVQDGIAVLVAAVGLLTMAAWLGRVEPWLPIVCAGTALPTAWLRRHHARLRVAWQDAHVGEQRDVGYAGAVLTGRATAKEVRVLGIAPWFGERLQGLRGRLRASLAALAGRRGRDELWVSALASLGLFATYYVLAREALLGGLSLGALVLQAQAAQRVQNGARDLLAALAGEREHRQFLNPVVEFLARKPAMVECAGPASPPPAPPPGLALAGARVAFRYPEAAQDALTGLSFTVAAGERIGIVGANGSGKSTLVKLLARLYDPTAGALLVDGTDLRALAPISYRARLSVLLQDASLFELSVRENLTLGAAAAPGDEELWRTLAAVGMDSAVRTLPAGLDATCSARVPGGVDWSFGQARRLLLARALLRPCRLLLLDEPFAALDPAAAQAVAQHLAAQPRGATMVLVDHRLECLRFCDRVLVMAAGAVVAAGSPTELADRDPRLAALRQP